MEVDFNGLTWSVRPPGTNNMAAGELHLRHRDVILKPYHSLKQQHFELPDMCAPTALILVIFLVNRWLSKTMKAFPV